MWHQVNPNVQHKKGTLGPKVVAVVRSPAAKRVLGFRVSGLRDFKVLWVLGLKGCRVCLGLHVLGRVWGFRVLGFRGFLVPTICSPSKSIPEEREVIAPQERTK